MVVALKSLNNFSYSNPNDPHAFKEVLKIKYSTVSAITRRFPGGTGILEDLLKAETPPRDWGNYCGLIATAQIVWEEKAGALNKAMLLLLNLKNNNAKKDLRCAYPQGNKIAYPINLESMARYLLSTYSIKSANNPRYKKGDKNGKKGDEPKSEDKDNNTSGTACAHIGETATPKDSSAPSNGSSISAHASEVEDPDARPTQSVQEILATHAINDLIWDHTDACDVLFDTKNSAEALAGSHTTGGWTYTFCRSDPHNLIYNDDVSWYDGSDFLDSYNK